VVLRARLFLVSNAASLQLAAALVLSVIVLVPFLGAKDTRAFVARQGGVWGSALCLAKLRDCRPDPIEVERTALATLVTRAVKGRISWEDFTTRVLSVNQTSEGSFFAHGWVRGNRSFGIVSQRAESVRAQLERVCDGDPLRCWKLKSITVGGRLVTLEAPQLSQAASSPSEQATTSRRGQVPTRR
jgi:hypothetical protein